MNTIAHVDIDQDVKVATRRKPSIHFRLSTPDLGKNFLHF